MFVEDAIVSFEDKNDFDSCTNPKFPHNVGIGADNLDAFIAVQNTKEITGSVFFASAAYCTNGFKLEIEIEPCN